MGAVVEGGSCQRTGKLRLGRLRLKVPPIACLASSDNGKTWRDHARSPQTLAPYSIGGCRQVTATGYLIGSFTHPARPGAPAKVYFFRIPARPGRQSSPARGERR